MLYPYSLRIVSLYRSAVGYIPRMTPIADVRPDFWSRAIVYTGITGADVEGSRCRIETPAGTCSCEVGFVGERWIKDDYGNVLA
jgi:hypothetical protein